MFLDPIKVQPFSLSENIDIIDKNTKAKMAANQEGPTFSDMLEASMLKVNDLQVDSDNMIQKMSLGEVEDVSQVAIAVEKAELALRLMVQIRDKMLDAYQQIGRMGA
jgi:flagellar hook-basal body complex protein FliE